MLFYWFGVWFRWLHEWKYWGVFFLMALESSIVPVPSEIVVPPAAFWATQGQMNFFYVWLFSTLGSLFGSVVNYAIAWRFGKPFLERYGKYFFLTAKRLEACEYWLKKFGFFSVFIARLLPGVRHFISLPCGALRMEWKRFCVSTTLGAGLWCYLLGIFGVKIIGRHPEILDSVENLYHFIKIKLFPLTVLSFGFLCVWFVVLYLQIKYAKNFKDDLTKSQVK